MLRECIHKFEGLHSKSKGHMQCSFPIINKMIPAEDHVGCYQMHFQQEHSTEGTEYEQSVMMLLL